MPLKCLLPQSDVIRAENRKAERLSLEGFEKDTRKTFYFLKNGGQVRQYKSQSGFLTTS